jgi:hypothetical protein
VLWDVASLSTDCDTLYDSLNRKRLLDPSEAVHIRLKILEEMLGRLNKDQGLGVVIFGKVLDRRALAAGHVRQAARGAAGHGRHVAIRADINAKQCCWHRHKLRADQRAATGRPKHVCDF